MRGDRGRARTIAAMAVGVLLALSGCGDDRVEENNAYVAAADRVVRSFNAEFQKLQAGFTSASTAEEDRRTLIALQRAVDRAALRLGRVQAPEAIAPLHAQLIAQVRAYGGAIEAARDGFGSDNLERIAEARRRFNLRLRSVGRQIMQTITTINARLR